MPDMNSNPPSRFSFLRTRKTVFAFLAITIAFPISFLIYHGVGMIVDLDSAGGVMASALAAYMAVTKALDSLDGLASRIMHRTGW